MQKVIQKFELKMSSTLRLSIPHIESRLRQSVTGYPWPLRIFVGLEMILQYALINFESFFNEHMQCVFYFVQRERLKL